MKRSQDKFWIKLEIRLPKEWEDILSVFLVETTGHGIQIEEQGLYSRISGYIPSSQDKSLLKKILHYLNFLKTSLKDVSFSFQEIKEENWASRWQEHFKPFKVTSNIVIKPSWEDYIPSSGEIILEIDPGQAFGTGHHPSTYLVLQSMEDLFLKVYNPLCISPQVLDIGTGTGILAMAAAKMGASQVWALDIDPKALEIAKQNILRNNLDSLINITNRPLSSLEKRFDLILANIGIYELKEMAFNIVKRLKSKGFLILSGFLKEQSDELFNLYSRLGTKKIDEKIDLEFEKWATLVLQKEDTDL